MEKDLEILNLTIPTLSIRESKALLAGNGYGWEGPSTYDYDLDLGDRYSIEIHQDFDGHFHIDFNREPIVEREELEELPTPNVTFEIDPIDVTETISETDIHVADNDSSPSSEQEDDHSHEQDDDPSYSFDRDDDHSHDQDDDRDNDRDGDYDINNDARDNNEGDSQEINGWENFDINKMLENAEKQMGSTCVLAAVYALLCGYDYFPQGIRGWEDIGRRFAKDTLPKNSGMNSDGYYFKLFFSGNSSGLDNNQIETLLNQYFDGVETVNRAYIGEALKNGPVLGSVNVGDLDGNPETYDGHAVVIYDYDENTEMITFWDPEDGKIHVREQSDVDFAWSINGIKN